MKRFWYSFLFIGLLGVCVVSCDSDNPTDPDNPDNINSTIRYESSVDDVANYKLRVMYMEEYEGAYSAESAKAHLKEVIVESPFSYEMKNRKKGTYLYISVFAVPRNDLVTPETTVTSRILIDGKLHEEKEAEVSAIIQHILGTP
jgi:hypothetical protein